METRRIGWREKQRGGLHGLPLRITTGRQRLGLSQRAFAKLLGISSEYTLIDVCTADSARGVITSLVRHLAGVREPRAAVPAG